MGPNFVHIFLKRGKIDKMETYEKTYFQELTIKMKEAENESHEGKRKVEALWPVFKIHHQKSRYIFDLFYKRKAISVRKTLLFLQNFFPIKKSYSQFRLIAVTPNSRLGR